MPRHKSDKVGGLYYWIGNLSQILVYSDVLFIIDDIIVDEGLDKRRQSLLELAISGRHRERYLWLLTQSYSAIPKILRRQTIHDGNNVLTDDGLVVVKDLLKKSRHACLYIRNEYPHGFCVK